MPASRAVARPTGHLAAREPPTALGAETPVDLEVDLGRGLRLESPLVAAAGCFGVGIEVGGVAALDGLGAIVTRSITSRPRPGNRPPRVVEVGGGLVNAVGLQNPGVEAVERRLAGLWAERAVPVVVSVAGGSTGEFVEVVRRLDGLPGIAGWELNLSCPNGARSGALFALEPDAAASLVGAVRRATDLTVIAKLSPSLPDPRPMARGLTDAGADAICAVNTFPALVLDDARAGPGLGSRYGGLSGPALKPIALRVVYEVAQVVDVPVIGVGGIAGIADVLDFLAVGASAVQVGTALLADPSLAARLAQDLAAECRRRGQASHRELVGTALAARPDATAARGAEYRP